MKRLFIYISAFAFFFAGCSNKPSCDDENVQKAVIEKIKEDTLSTIMLGVGLLNGKLLGADEAKKTVDNEVNIKLDSFMTEESKDEKVTMCKAKLILEFKGESKKLLQSLKQSTKESAYIKYNARFTDNGKDVYVELKKTNKQRG